MKLIAVQSNRMEAGTEKSSPGWLRRVVIGRNPLFTLIRIAILVTTIFLLRAYVVLPIQVKGDSMMPTYQSDGVNFVNRLSYRRADPQRGDIVAIRHSGEHVMLLKRIVGLPGEMVGLHNGRVIVDGVMLEEPYVKIEGEWNRRPELVGPNEYFVIGDNRSNSVFGKTERRRIVGKIILWKNLFASSPSPS